MPDQAECLAEMHIGPTLCKICVVVDDDAIGYTVSAHQIGHKADRSRTIHLLDWASLNPLGKLFHYHQEMCHATSCSPEWTNHVQPPHCKRPCYWDCFQC